MVSACNVMFNIGTGMENVTHLKNRSYFSMVFLSVGQHLSLWPAIKTLSPDREKLYSELASISVMYIIVFTLWIFVIFLKNICVFFRYLMNISKYSQNATRQYQTLFYFIVNHHIQCRRVDICK